MQDGSGYRVSCFRWVFLQHAFPSNTGVICRKCSSANLLLGNKTGVWCGGGGGNACVGVCMCVCVSVCVGGGVVCVGGGLLSFVCLPRSMVYLAQGNKYNEYHTPQANIIPGLLSSLK